MAYVEPCGTIELYQLVTQPLNPSYNHTLWFPNETAQRTFFTNHLFGRYTNQMYTRVNSNTIRIQGLADNLRNCNYMGFNNGRTSRWYYAFIINQDYINENVTEITFVIDEIQSWYLSCSWNECFIERQHSTSDQRGDNLQPEPFAISDYIVTNSDVVRGSWDIGYILVVGTVTKTNASILNQPWTPLFQQDMFGGFGSTLKYIYIDSPDKIIDLINRANFVDGALKGIFQSDDLWTIIGLYVVPTDFFNVDGGDTISILGVSGLKTLAEYVETIIVPTYDPNNHPNGIHYPTYHGFSGFSNSTYEPINKKLLTYPYTYLSVETPISNQDYKYESFSGNNFGFKIYGCCNPEPSVIIVPDSYNHDENNYRYSLTVNGFPMLPVYECGMFENAGRNIGASIKEAVSQVVGYLASVPANGTEWINYAPTTALATQPEYPENIFGKNIVHKEPAKQSEGFDKNNAAIGLMDFASHELPRISTNGSTMSTGGSGNLAPILAPKHANPEENDRFFVISFNQIGLRAETARKFDEYLSKYGYAQNTVNRPNIHARENWTYIKTKDCCVSGPMPYVAIETINKVMNAGITWWSATGTAGRYVGVHNGAIEDFYNPPVSVG